MSASINMGVPLVVDEAMHPVSTAIHDIAAMLQDRLHGQAAATPSQGGSVDQTGRGRRRFSLLRRGGAR